MISVYNPPPDWCIWSHYSDGLWRAGCLPQSNCITPQTTREKAIDKAFLLYYAGHQCKPHR